MTATTTADLSLNEIAAGIRSDVRAAVRDSSDVLHGLTISVRKMTGSMVFGVEVVVRGLDSADLVVPQDEREPGAGWATARAQAISARLHVLAAPAVERADGRHRFCEISFDGLMAPSPRA